MILAIQKEFALTLEETARDRDIINGDIMVPKKKTELEEGLDLVWEIYGDTEYENMLKTRTGPAVHLRQLFPAVNSSRLSYHFDSRLQKFRWSWPSEGLDACNLSTNPTSKALSSCLFQPTVRIKKVIIYWKRYQYHLVTL
jgi:hypothetical protein